jgi:GMP synthase-like glutamine amidotransferase
VRVHYLQHVPYERVGWIQDWAESRGHQIAGTLMYEDPTGAGALPGPMGVDLLVVMGGPMNIYQHNSYPWLVNEKRFIRTCIAKGKAVLGICLGGQLIADSLGGVVTKNPHEEIGWYPVELTEEGRQMEVFAHFPDTFITLQWHGDTFSIPPGATRAAFSEATRNQAFTYDGERVIGLQFHLEETRETLGELVGVARLKGEVCATPGSPEYPWVSPLDDLLAPDAPFDACGEMLFGLLDRMVMR